MKIYAADEWTPKVYNAVGRWAIGEDGNQYYFELGEDFKTSPGPDLKVYLTTTPIAQITDREPVDEAGLFLGVLEAFSGKQRYPIPANINLKDHQSIVIHCKAYSVVWAGVDLNPIDL